MSIEHDPREATFCHPDYWNHSRPGGYWHPKEVEERKKHRTFYLLWIKWRANLIIAGLHRQRRREEADELVKQVKLKEFDDKWGRRIF